MRSRAALFAGLLLAVGSLLWAQSRVPPPARDSGAVAAEIQPDQLAAHLQFLASDLLEGRAPSTRGGELAAAYLATQLATLGYAPAGDNGTYYQNLSIVESVLDPRFTLNVTGGPSFKYMQEVVAFKGLQEPRVDVGGEVVFVGHGIVAPEYRWNDYAGIDMRGKIALIMVNDPPATAGEPGLFGGTALTYYGRWTYKYEEAARQGAAGAILIHTDESATYPWQVVQSGFSGTQYDVPTVPGAPVLRLQAWVTNDAAKALVARSGKDLDTLRQGALARGAAPVALGVEVSASVEQTIRRRTAANVVGVLKGSKPSEGVVYTAHYDHFGIRDARPGEAADVDRIYNGALDNASGSAGVLEVAQALARAGRKPARSIYIVFTTAEESGLLGSEYFATHLPLPAAQWAANINIDVLNVYGPARDIVLIGAERSSIGPLATEIARRTGRVVSPDPEPQRGFFYRSDHFPLAKVGIPAVSLAESTQFTGAGAAEMKTRRDAFNGTDYHQPSDEIKPWYDYDGAVADLRFFAELGWHIANMQAMPVYNANEQFARPRQ